MKDLIEIMAIASALGFIADCIWIVVEMMDVGFKPSKLIIMMLLNAALMLQMYALYKFHCNLARDIKTKMSTDKKQAVKTQIRVQRKQTEAKMRGK